MVIEDQSQNLLLEHGTLHYKFMYTKDGKEVIIGANLIDVPVEWRERLQYVQRRLSLMVQEIMLQIVEELEK